MEQGLVQINIALNEKGLNYQKLLQQCENIQFTKETINQDYLPLKQLREAATLIKNLENPHTKAWQAWNADRKSIADPIDDCLNRKTAEFTQLNNEIKAENSQNEAEKLRVKTIQDNIDSFLMDYAVLIANAETLLVLLQLEREINLETAYAKKYQEFLPSLVERSKAIRDLLKSQKEKVKDLAAVQNKIEAAAQNKDLGTLNDLETEKEIIEHGLKETQKLVQQTSLSQSMGEKTIVPESTLIAVKPRRSAWTWDITDVEKFQKKYPHFVDMEPNRKKIDEWFTKMKKDKTIQETDKDGIKIYVQHLY